MTIPDRTTILRVLGAAYPELQRRFGLRSMSVFGSVARGDMGADSDVDILVEFEGRVGLFELADLRCALRAIVGREVDVGTVASLRPRARDAALAEALRVA